MRSSDRKRRWRERNADHVRKKQREYTAAWRKRNPEKELARQRKRYSVKRAKRRAKELAAVVPLTLEQRAMVVAVYAKARALTEMTGISYHVDHIVPLARGGKHHPDNLQILTAKDNIKKGCGRLVSSSDVVVADKV